MAHADAVTDLSYEWVVTEDGDPRPVVTYRGPDETEARETFSRVTVVSGWGATLTRRLVGRPETVEVRR